MFSLILLVFAFVLFVLSGAVNPPENPWRTRMVCFGWACVALAMILEKTPVLFK
jgi:hypothetical protein